MDTAATFIGPMDAAVDFDQLSTNVSDIVPDYDPNDRVKNGYGALVRAIADPSALLSPD